MIGKRKSFTYINDLGEAMKQVLVNEKIIGVQRKSTSKQILWLLESAKYLNEIDKIITYGIK